MGRMSEAAEERTGLSKPFRTLLSRKLRSSRSKTKAEASPPVVRLSDGFRSSGDTSSDRILAADVHDSGQVGRFAASVLHSPPGSGDVS